MSDPYALLKHAKKLYDGASGGWNLFFNKTQKLENAKDAYLSAAYAFKDQNIYKEAGQAYEKAAKILTDDLEQPDDAANELIEASKMYRLQPDPAAAARCLTQSINRWTSQGSFRRAAPHMATRGECYEASGEKDKAVESYEKAGKWYEGDGSPALAGREYLRAADLHILQGDFHKAISILESFAVVASKIDKMRYTMKEYLYRAGMCHLAIGDMVAVKRAFEKYRQMDRSFTTTTESKHLQEMLKKIEGGKPDEIAQELFEWKANNRIVMDNSGRFEDFGDWRDGVYAKLQRAIDEVGEDFS